MLKSLLFSFRNPRATWRQKPGSRIESFFLKNTQISSRRLVIGYFDALATTLAAAELVNVSVTALALAAKL